jgi:hypothetical protein
MTTEQRVSAFVAQLGTGLGLTAPRVPASGIVAMPTGPPAQPPAPFDNGQALAAFRADRQNYPTQLVIDRPGKKPAPQAQQARPMTTRDRGPVVAECRAAGVSDNVTALVCDLAIGRIPAADAVRIAGELARTFSANPSLIESNAAAWIQEASKAQATPAAAAPPQPIDGFAQRDLVYGAMQESRKGNWS